MSLPAPPSSWPPRMRTERAGFQGEAVTIPSLPDAAEWERFNAARLALGPNLSRDRAAGRYRQ